MFFNFADEKIDFKMKIEEELFSMIIIKINVVNITINKKIYNKKRL